MTYEDLRERWRARALRDTTNLIESLCELRDLLTELPQLREQILSDFASDYGKARRTVEDYLHIIGGYTAEEMQRWVVAGLRFDHLEKARQYADAKQMTPAALLDFAMDGGPEGKRMTVDEMVSFALGEKEVKTPVQRFQRMYDALLKFPSRYGWDEQKRERFEAEVKKLWEFFE